MNNSQMEALVASTSYKPGWTILFRTDGTRPYIQISVDERSDATIDPHSKHGLRVPWKSAKFYLSQHMSTQEVIGAVYGLIQRAEQHETSEWFRYRGASIFNQHLHPDVLWEVARKASSFDMRLNAMTMEE